jgi:hypothetical protein
MTDGFADLLDDDDTALFLELAKDKCKPKREGKPRAAQWIGCPLPWLVEVAKKTTRGRQLLVMLLLYRRCCQCKTGTVTLPTRECEAFGMNRHKKVNTLRQLRRLGLLKIAQRPGMPARITVIGWRNSRTANH